MSRTFTNAFLLLTLVPSACFAVIGIMMAVTAERPAPSVAFEPLTATASYLASFAWSDPYAGPALALIWLGLTAFAFILLLLRKA